MRKWVWLAAAAGLYSATPVVADVPPPSQAAVGVTASNADSDLMADATVAGQKTAAGDAKGAQADLEVLVHGKAFAAASPQAQAYVLAQLTDADGASADYPDAIAHWTTVGDLMPAMKSAGDYWRMMALLTYLGDKNDLAVDAYVQWVGIAPGDIYEFTGDFVGDLVRRARRLPDDHRRYRKLLEALWQVHYEPKDDLFMGENTRLQLFEIRAQAGDDAGARALLATFKRPDTVIALRSDNRYRRLIVDAPGFSDFKAVEDRYIEGLKAANAPGQLRTSVALGYALIDANRLSEALAVLDTAISEAQKTPPAPEEADQVKWLMDTRMRVLRHLGRWDEVVAAEIQARDTALKENLDLVSQKINLGGIYYALGRPKDALAEVADIKPDQASVYGQMSAEEVRACAYAQLGDAKALKASLDLMRTHADEAAGPLRAAMLCADDKDGAAAALIARLDNPDERNAALLGLQTYLSDPHETSFEQQLDARETAVENRPDVKAAIAKYGVIETYPEFSPPH